MPSDAQPPRRGAVHVATPGGSYEIHIGAGLLDQGAVWSGLPTSQLGLIVSNPQVAALYGDRLRQSIAPRHAKVDLLELPDGEAHKTWQSLNLIFDRLLALQADRRTVLYALGGGVVGDMSGFAAACFMRGISFVQVPTTLLAQVDSSVGGKTAINHPLGKNMIGAFYQPLSVVCDLDTLRSLPDRELRAGLAEVIKYGPIHDLAFLDWIEASIEPLLARDADALAYAVARSCQIKAEVVGVDERESGLRAILNFGHTFGHAIESGIGYGQWLHGEAVGCGMVLAAALSRRLGGIDAAFERRLRSVIERAGLPVKPPAMSPGRWLELMRHDKKAEAGAMRFVLLDPPGRAVLKEVNDSVVVDLLDGFGAR